MTGVCLQSLPAPTIAHCTPARAVAGGLPDVYPIDPGAGARGRHGTRGHTRGQRCKLNKNLAGLRCRDGTAEVRLDKLAGGKEWFYTHGAAVGDYDRDGWPDLLVTGWGRVALLHNEPDGTGGRRFIDVTQRAGLGAGITWASSAAFGGLDGDRWPDLYLCQYVDCSWQEHPACTYDGKTADVGPPKNFHGLQHKLYHNTGQGTFVDVSLAAGLRPGGTPRPKGLGVLLVDIAGECRPEVYVANDTVDNFLYLNRSQRGTIRLDAPGLLARVARDERV